jgi:ribose transport system permease protein
MMSLFVKNPLSKRYVAPMAFVMFIIVLLIVLNEFVDGKILSGTNLITIFVNTSVPIFVAWGFMFIFAVGITDLSVGAVIILAANIAGTFGNSFGYPGLVLSGIISGVLLMTINFTIFEITGIPSWIAGMGITMIYEATTALYARHRLKSGLRLVSLDSGYRELGKAPMVFVVILIGFMLAFIIYNRTTIGLNIRALGHNRRMAKLMSIPVTKTVICSGAVAGIFIGMAAIVKESFAGTVNSVTGLSSLVTTFQPLAAVLLAQALQKFMNIATGVLVSSVFIMTVFNVLTQLGVASGTWQETILGLSVILFGVAAQRRITGVVK